MDLFHLIKKTEAKISNMISYTKAAITIALFWAPSALSCLNDQDYKYEDGDKMRSCANIRLQDDRRTALCQKAEVRDACPQTCGICCEDDPDFTFPLEKVSGVEQDCAWITQNENKMFIRQANYCGMGDRVGDTSIRNMCPLACDFCQELVDVIPTEAPTTAAPTTPAPTTAAPTTAAPTTAAPTTAAPTTAAPTTAAPTTPAPTTAAPTTAAPTTAAPTTAAPTTAAPTTAAPTTPAPTTAAPTTAAPTTPAPTTAAPTTAAPTTPAPTPLCVDSSAFEFELKNFPGEMRGCDWISKNENQKATRQEAYCGEVADSCPLACEACVCEDDPEFEFELQKLPGEMRGCDWISKNENQMATRQAAYCGEVADSCPVACGEC